MDRPKNGMCCKSGQTKEQHLKFSHKIKFINHFQTIKILSCKLLCYEIICVICIQCVKILDILMNGGCEEIQNMLRDSHCCSHATVVLMSRI